MQLMPGVGPTSAQRVLDRRMEAADPIGALAGAPSPPRSRRRLDRLRRNNHGSERGRAGWPAELERARLWYEPHLERIHEDSGTRHADLIQLEQIANGYPPGAFPDRNLRSIRRTRRVTRQACRCSTRTI
jgi:DNA helicase-2/ATP-dependent DNA helicase PcrA